jgi:hypothetical protein
MNNLHKDKDLSHARGPMIVSPVGYNPHPLSYESIIKSKRDFKRAGGLHMDEYDIISNKYFKILFHFYNNDYAENKYGNGLLHPTWMYESDGNYTHNSAYSYLKMNSEDERAEMLQDFITLLSNINCNSPWYFKEISGLDAALERNIYDTIKVEEQRKKISIKCLQDSFDDRIGSLMDLYRAIVWSWQMKREVIPSNLRKFDMSIYIFNDEVIPYHSSSFKSDRLHVTDTDDLKNMNLSFRKKGDDDFAYMTNNDGLTYKTSYKYIEFHNCEFDYNSAKTPYSTLDNSQGISPEYTIDIYFDDCYETRYNEILMKEFGDLIAWDVANRHVKTEKPNRNYSEKQSYYATINETAANEEKKGFWSKLAAKATDAVSKAADQLVTTGLNWVDNHLKSAVLGNIYTYSLTNIGSQISALMNGNVLGSVNAVKEYVEAANKRKEPPAYSGNKNIHNGKEHYHIHSEEEGYVTKMGEMYGYSNYTTQTRGESYIEGGNVRFNDSLDKNIFDNNYKVAQTRGETYSYIRDSEENIIGYDLGNLDNKDHNPDYTYSPSESGWTHIEGGNNRYNNSLDKNIFDDNKYYEENINVMGESYIEGGNVRFNDSLDKNIFDDDYSEEYIKQATITNIKKSSGNSLGKLFDSNTIVNNL